MSKKLEQLIQELKLGADEFLAEIRYSLFEDYEKYSKKALKEVADNKFNRYSFDKSFNTIKANMVEILVADDNYIKGSGSGIKITTDGYILTAHHVIEQSMKDKELNIYAKTQSGTIYKIESDKIYYNSLSDLGMIKANVEKTFFGPKPIQAKINYSEKVLKNENIYLLGFLEGKLSISTGKILDPDVNLCDVGGQLMNNLFETNALGNKGQSGGAIINSEGELIGIVVYGNRHKSANPESKGYMGASKIFPIKGFIEKLTS